MSEHNWGPESSRTLVCVDSYHKGVPVGRFFHVYQDGTVFESLSQFLVKMEEMLEDVQKPQSYTATRTFASTVNSLFTEESPVTIRRGARATFEIRVIFRQHTSWQGIILWKEKNLEQSFRSVLELILLIDNALRSQTEIPSAS